MIFLRKSEATDVGGERFGNACERRSSRSGKSAVTARVIFPRSPERSPGRADGLDVEGHFLVSATGDGGSIKWGLGRIGEILVAKYLEEAAPSIEPVAVEMYIEGLVNGVAANGLRPQMPLMKNQDVPSEQCLPPRPR
jgi:hypothetical protein